CTSLRVRACTTKKSTTTIAIVARIPRIRRGVVFMRCSSEWLPAVGVHGSFSSCRTLRAGRLPAASERLVCRDQIDDERLVALHQRVLGHILRALRIIDVAGGA